MKKKAKCAFRERFQNVSYQLFIPLLRAVSMKKLFTKLVALATLVLAGGGGVQAQSTANYAFSTNTTGSLSQDANGNAVSMTVAGGATQLVAAATDNSTSAVSNIGFPFVFMGGVYTQFSVSSNGVLQLGASGVSGSTYVASGGTSTAPKFSPLSSDGRTASTTDGGGVYFRTVGSSPNRCMIAQWVVYSYWSSTNVSVDTFQMRLYESTGVVEYVYGSMPTGAAVYSTGYQTGFSVGSSTNQLASVNISTNAVSYSSFSTYTATANTNFPNIHTPISGQRRRYIFTPPQTAPTDPTTLTFTALSSNATTLNWVDNSTNEINFVVVRATDAAFTQNVVITSVASTTSAGTGTAYSSAQTGLTPGTTYYYKVQATTEGKASAGLTGNQATNAATTYYWRGPATGNWDASVNWNTDPTGNSGTDRTTPATSDILVVDGPGSITGNVTINVNVTNPTIGQFYVTNGTGVTLVSNNTTTRTITVSGGPGDDFSIASGSSLTLNSTSNAVAFAYSGSGNTGTIAGTLNIGGSTSNKVDVTGGTGSVTTVTSTGIVNHVQNSSGTVLFVGSTSSLVFANGATLNLSNVVSSAPAVPLATWGAASNLNISGVTSGTSSLANTAQSFGNITWDNPSATGALTLLSSSTATIQGNLDVTNAGTGTLRITSTGTVTVNGDVIVRAGTNTSNGAVQGATSGGVTISGNLIVNGGSFSTASSTGYVDVLGNTTIASSATFYPSGGATGTNAAVFYQSGSTFTNNGTITAATAGAGVMYFGGTTTPVAQTFAGTGSMTGALATLSVDNGGLTISNTNAGTVLRALRANMFTGNLTGSNKLTIGNSGSSTAAVQFGNGSGTPLVGGNFDVAPNFDLGTGTYNIFYSLEPAARTTGNAIPTGRPVSNIYLSNTNGLILGNPVAVGVFTFQTGAGAVTTTSTNLLTITGTTTGSITGATATAFVNGPLERTLPAALGTGTTYVFPIGKGTSYKPFSLVNPTTSSNGSVTVKAEVFNVNSGGTATGLLGSINTNRYWVASITAGSGNFGNTQIRLTDTGGVGTADAIGASTTVNGSYDMIGGTTATVTSADITSNSNAPITSIGNFYVMGTRSTATLSNLTITPSGNQCTNVARTVAVDVTPGGSAISSVVIDYKVNGGATQTVSMTNTTGNTWSGVIPTVTPSNGTVTWSVTVTDANFVRSLTGASYTDEPTNGVTATASATRTSVCVGSNDTLSLVLSKLGSKQVGMGTTTSVNNTFDGGSFYGSWWGNSRQQWLITAAELQAAGLSAGPLTSLSIDVIATGTPATMNNFTIRLGQTTATALTTTFVNGLTQVYTGNYTPVAGATNTHIFGTGGGSANSFVWDGTSNLIVDNCYGNNAGGSTSATNKYSVPGYNCGTTYGTDGTTAAATICATATGTVRTYRPNIIFAGNTAPAVTAYSWSDGTATVGTSNPQTVTVGATHTYTGTATVSGCPISGNVTVTVNPIPTVPTGNSSVQCGTGVPTASVASTSGFSGSTFSWYVVATGGTAVQNSASTTFTTALDTTTTFYVAERSSDGCESPRVAVTVTVNPPPALTLDKTKVSVCNGGIATLSVTSNAANFNSYVWSPTTDLYTDAGATTAYTGGSTPTVYAKPAAAGSTVYTLTATNSTTTCASTENDTVVGLPVVAVTVTPLQSCLSVTPTATLANGTTYTSAGAAIAWSTSTDSSTFTTVSGANGETYTPASPITTNTFFRATVTDGTGATCAAAAKAGVYDPTVVSTTPATRCGFGPVTLSATTNAGSTLSWYAAETGGVALQTGGTFTPPIVTADTAYYVGAALGGNNYNVGKVSTNGADGTNTGTASYLKFNALNNFTLKSVVVYPYGTSNGPGTMTISLQNSAGITLQSATVNVTASTSTPVAQTVALNFAITPGTDYRLTPTAYSGAVTGGYRDNTAASGISFPYTVPNVVSITDGSLAGYYYYFYNWSISTSCESPRTRVPVTVTPPPALALDANTVNICGPGTVGTLAVSAATAGNYTTFVWSPTTNLYTDAAGTTPYTAASNATMVYVKSPTAGAATYTLTASDASGCQNAQTAVATTRANYVTSITPAAATICAGGQDTLTFSFGNSVLPSGYCTPTIGTVGTTYYIDSFYTTGGSTNITNNSTGPSTGGFADYTASYQLIAERNDSVTFRIGRASGTYGYAVWVDWNQDGLYDTTEQMYRNPTTSYIGGLTAGFKVPATALTGKTRMRVTADGSKAQVSDPCAISNGESEEYTFVVGPTPSAYSWSDGTTTVGASNPLIVTASGTATYTATATANGCPFTASITRTPSPVPTTPTANAGAHCGSQTPNASVTSTSGLSGSTFRWYLSSTGGTALAGQTGSSLNNYPVSTTTTFYVSEVSAAGCEGPRVPVIENVTNAAAVTLSNNTLNVCNGTVGSVSVTSPLSDYDTYIWTPTTNLFTDPAATIPYVGGNITTVYFGFASAGVTKYTITATKNATNCINTDTVAVTVQPAYTATAAASLSTFCAGTSTTLTASANVGTPFVELFNSPTVSSFNVSGTGGTATQSTTYYSEGNSSLHFNNSTTSSTAYLTQSSNMDLSGVPSAMLTFDHIAAMEGYGTTYDYGKVEYSTNGGTTWTAFPASSYTGNSLLYSGNQYFSTRSYTDWINTITSVTSTPANNLWKTETFTIPAAALTSQFRIRFSYYGDVSNFYYGWLIDNLKISGTESISAITWSNGTSTVGNTNPLTVSPTATTTYTANITVAGCPLNTNPVTVTVNPVPSAPTATNSTQCGAQTPTASVTSTSGAATPTFKWYTAATGGTAIAGQTGASLSNYSVSGTTTFYVTEVSAAGCESSPRTPVTVTFTAAPALATTSGTTKVAVCNGGIRALSVSTATVGNYTNYTWLPIDSLYTDAAATIPYTAGTNASTVYVKSTAVITSKIYTVTGTGGGCQNTATADVRVLPVVAVTVSTATICGASGTPTATLSNNAAFTATSSTIAWATSPDSITFTTVGGATATTYTPPSPITATTYYRVTVTNSGNACGDAARAVNVYNPTVTGTTPASRCGDGSVTLQATSAPTDTLKWYAAATGGTALASGPNFTTPVITANTTYYVSATRGGCTSARTAVLATVSSSTPIAVDRTKIVTCNNDTAVLSVTAATVGNYTTYTWSPVDSLYTDAATTIPYTAGTNASTVYVKNGTVGQKIYTVTGSDASNCSAIAKDTVIVLPPVAVTVSPTNICLTAMPTATLTGGTTFTANNATIAWATSPDSVTFTPVTPAATGVTYTPASAVTSQMFYQATVTSAAGRTCGIAAAGVSVNSPTVVSTTPATRCGPGVVTLQATGSAGTTLNWYAAATGGTALFTGGSYTPPAITADTAYYVGAVSAASTISTARTAPAAIANTTPSSYGLAFDVNSAFNLNSVDVYNGNTSTGTVTVQLQNSAGIVLETSGVFNIPAGTGDINTSTPTVLPLNWNIPTGTGYKLIATTGTANLIREVNLGGFPYAIGSVGSITGGAGGNALNYYYFYNWSISAGCETPRTRVPATINPPAALEVTARKVSACNNVAEALSVSSATVGNYTTYTWSPATDLYLDAAGTTPYTAASNATTVYVKRSAVGQAVYTVTGTDASSCNNTATDTVTVLPALNVTLTPTAVCGGSGTPTATLTNGATYTSAGATIAWAESPDSLTFTPVPGANGITYTPASPITATTFFQATVTNATGTVCGSPAAQTAVATPTVTGTTPATRCGAGPVTLQATGSAGTTLNWYAAATGGVVLGTGSSFTTPAVSTTKDFYVSASVLSGNYAGARTAPATLTGGTGANQGLRFDATSDFTLNSVDVYNRATTSGTMVVKLQNSSGVDVQTSGTFTIPAGTGNLATTNPYTANLNWSVPAGTNYRLVMSSGTANLTNEANVFPATIAIGSVGNIIGGYNNGSSTTYYDFYNWKVSTRCESPRTAVTATVGSAPAVAVTQSTQAICNGSIAEVSVSAATAGNYGTFTWTGPANTIYTDATATTPYSGGPATTVYVKPTFTGNNVYTVTGSGGNPGCGNAATATVNMLPVVAVTVAPGSLCGSGTPTATLVNGITYSNAGATIAWAESPDSVTFTPVSGANGVTYTPANPITANTYYQATVTVNGNTCTPGARQVTITPAQIITTQPTAQTVCAGQTLNLSVAASGATGYQWYKGTAPSGTLISGATNATYTVANASVADTGNYYVAVSGASPCAAVNSNDVTVTVNPPVVITTQPANTAVCDASTLTLTVAANNATTYQWYGPSGIISGATSNTYTLANVTSTDAGSYTVVIDANAPCASVTSNTATVTVTPQPNATITYAGAPYCNDAGTATVTLTGTIGGSFSSTSGLSIDTTTGAINLTGSTAGTYTVTYTVAAAGGCGVYTTPTSVTINPAPTGTFAYSGTPYCATVTSAMPTGTALTAGGIYSATPNSLTINGTTGEINPSTSAAGTYTVTYTVAAANGCNPYTTTATVSVDNPVVTLSAAANTMNCGDPAVALTITPTGASTPALSWNTTYGLYTDAAANTPYTGGGAPTTLYAKPASDMRYEVTLSSGSCTSPAVSADIEVNSGVTTLAQASTTANITYFQIGGVELHNDNCEVIASVTPSGTAPINGMIGAGITVGPAGVLYTDQPYAGRVVHISPQTNAANATATLTLYVTQAELDAYTNVVAGLSDPGYWSAAPANSADVANAANLRVTQFHGTGGPVQYTGVQLTPTTTPTYDATLQAWAITVDVDSFSDFYIHTQNSNNTPLPVRFTGVAATAEKGRNRIEWNVGSEEQVERYEVEKEVSGSFVKLGTVPAVGEAQYVYYDGKPVKGRNTYRIKAVDVDGRHSYSPVATVLVSESGSFVLELYPNPTRDKVVVRTTGSVAGEATVMVRELSGRVVLQTTIAASEGTIDLGMLPSGTYLLQWSDGVHKEALRVTKQ